MPPAVARITGLSTAEWGRGVAPALAWERLGRAAEGVARLRCRPSSTSPASRSRSCGRCTRATGRGRSPSTSSAPTRSPAGCSRSCPAATLRALAGYFGAGVPPLRRSADHVAATAFVWRHLVALLAEREGVVDLAELREWLARPARRVPAPLAAAARAPPRAARPPRRLPAAARRRRRPLRRQGRLAAPARRRPLPRARRQSARWRCSRRRATSPAPRPRPRSRRRCWRRTRSSAWRPPFNVALAADRAGGLVRDGGLSRPAGAAGPGRTPWARSSRRLPSRRCRRCARPSPSAARPASPLRARAVGVEPAYAPGPGASPPGSPVRARARAGRRARAPPPPRRTAVGAPAAEAATAGRRRRGGAERLAGPRGTRSGCGRRWRRRSSAPPTRCGARAGSSGSASASLAWAEPGTERRRLLVIQGGAVAARADSRPGRPCPFLPGTRGTLAERRAAFDVATFDRLRVLTTELRGLAAGGRVGRAAAGPARAVSRRRLQAVLRWV